MFRKESVKCAKCGITSKENPSLTFHRFPLPSIHGSLMARVWATFCFPNDDWTSDASLEKLYKQHKMLCGNHFDDSSYTSSDRKRLNKFAIPTDAQNILAQLRDEQFNPVNPPMEAHEIQHPKSAVEVQMEVPASTSQNIVPIENSNIKTDFHPESPDLTKDSRKKKSILKDLDAKKITELTPRKQKLYKICRKNLSEIMRLRRKFRNMKKSQRSILSDLTCEDSVNEMIKRKLGSSFCLLLQSQLKNVPRKLTGRRWTLDDKVMALSIYKKSSTCYRLLRRLFCLPSESSLKALLNKIPLVCGINNQVIETIKLITEKRNYLENLCILAFDEMSIRKNLSYNAKLDQIEGFQDHGIQGRSSHVATHALTFMAIGLRKHWKQPMAFYFSGNCVTADRLAVLIKEVLRACFDAGLEVVGTVCDMDGVNIRAINSLGSSRDQPSFNFHGHEIVTILDPPHLLKCFRNNFMKHDIQYNTQDLQIEGTQTQGLAKWSHIQEFYNEDQLNLNFVLAPALTQQHLQPNGKQKMKVSLAAQVLSHSVAAGMFARIGLNQLPQDAIHTASLLLNIDKLFDAVNGDTPDRKNGKQFLTNITSTSPHLNFKKMKVFFKEMKFIGAKSKPPSQDGWLRTLNAIELIFYNLKMKYDIRSLSVRRLNQDPLENCFGCIRSNCGCNPNPTSVQFIAALKTSMITNLINNNKNRNCLDDNNEVLNNLKIFLEHKESYMKQNINPTSISNILYKDHIDEIDIPQCSSEMQACAYVCGFIVKNMAMDCPNCKKTMLADQNTEVCHSFTSFKEYNEERSSLNYVQYSFCHTVENAANIVNNYLKENPLKKY